MKKNSVIDIKKPKIFKKRIEPQNFSNTKKETYLLPIDNINNKIYKKIKECSKKYNILNLKDNEIISNVLKSYENLNLKKYLSEKEFDEWVNPEEMI